MTSVKTKGGWHMEFEPTHVEHGRVAWTVFIEGVRTATVDWNAQDRAYCFVGDDDGAQEYSADQLHAIADFVAEQTRNDRGMNAARRKELIEQLGVKPVEPEQPSGR